MKVTGILHLISYLDEKKNNIAQIGERYGVSGTHFRRLCKRYLGNCGKSQLRSWRAASSILTTLSTDESLTQIAVDNGFSSASHFLMKLRHYLVLHQLNFGELANIFMNIKNKIYCIIGIIIFIASFCQLKRQKERLFIHQVKKPDVFVTVNTHIEQFFLVLSDKLNKPFILSSAVKRADQWKI